MKRILYALMVGIFLVGSLYAQDTSKLDKFLNDKITSYKAAKAKGNDNGKEKVRVILKTLPSLKADAEDQAKKLGATDLRKFGILSAKAVEMPVEDVLR